MVKDDRIRRDVHALDENGMVLCNPRDKEAAHRAQMGDIRIGQGREVTCRKCWSLQAKVLKAEAEMTLDSREGLSVDSDMIAEDCLGREKSSLRTDQESADRPAPFVRIRGLASMVAEYRPGDGIDPKEEKRQKGRSQRKHKPDYTRERLANQIFDALSLSALLTDLGLEDFLVVAVHSIGLGNHFSVEVQCSDPTLPFDPGLIEQRLRSASGQFRHELSGFVHRKKVPELQFRVLPALQPPSDFL
jgi:hypothetical protein